MVISCDKVILSKWFEQYIFHISMFIVYILYVLLVTLKIHHKNYGGSSYKFQDLAFKSTEKILANQLLQNKLAVAIANLPNLLW